MHPVALTESGLELAQARIDFNSDDAEMYPEHTYEPGLADAWTIADDMLVMLEGPATVIATSTAYKDQQKAMLAALASFHPAALIVEGFKALCKAGLVDCVYNMATAIEDASVVFEALSSPVRLQILRHCLYNPSTASELKRVTGRQIPSIYHHTGKLQAAMLLYSRGHGEGYVTDGEMLASILKSLIDFFYPEGADDKTLESGS